MSLLIARDWPEYNLLDSGNGRRLERFGPHILSRPEPQALWKPLAPELEWARAQALFNGDENGAWVNSGVPLRWQLQWEKLTFWCKLTKFKHVGVFPEQSVNWEWIAQRVRTVDRPVSILNLFGYTGIATLVALRAGARVTHLDASKSSIAWARENLAASHLGDKPVRWIVDDAVKFVKREIRRGNSYDAIIMDPPVYGHGPHGEVWNFGRDFPILMDACRQLLSQKPLFVLVNAYAVSMSALMLQNVLTDFLPPETIEAGELVLEEKASKRQLSTGIFGRWSGI